MNCVRSYGNAETNNKDTGPGSMEALFWGNRTDASTGAGQGPWAMGDLEDGLWSGDHKHNPDNTPVMADFATAMLKGRPCSSTNGNELGQQPCFALKAGDSNQGDGLEIKFQGGRPPKYSPMKKQGAIILGIGGDNSDSGVGTFFEGAITSGWSSDVTDAAVQANIASVGYTMSRRPGL